MSSYIVDKHQSVIGKKKGYIQSDSSLLYGNFISDRLSFLVYDPDEK